MLARDQVGGERSATTFRPPSVQFCDQQINFHELMHFLTRDRNCQLEVDRSRRCWLLELVLRTLNLLETWRFGICVVPKL